MYGLRICNRVLQDYQPCGDTGHKTTISMRFVGGLRQQIQFMLNIFCPQSILEAHQQALTVEAQSRNNSVPWTTNRQTHQNQAASASPSTESASPKPETAFVSSDPSRQQRT